MRAKEGIPPYRHHNDPYRRWQRRRPGNTHSGDVASSATTCKQGMGRNRKRNHVGALDEESSGTEDDDGDGGSVLGSRLPPTFNRLLPGDTPLFLVS